MCQHVHGFIHSVVLLRGHLDDHPPPPPRRPCGLIPPQHFSMSATLVLEPAVRGEDGHPVPQLDCKEPHLLKKTVAVRPDMTVVMKKQEVADALGLGETSAEEPFEMPQPMFQQYVQMTEDYDFYYIKPKEGGWVRQPTLNFFVEVTKVCASRALKTWILMLRAPDQSLCVPWQGGVSRVALGSYTVDLTRDVEGVAVEVVDTTCLSKTKWRFSRRSNKDKKERSDTTKTEPLLMLP